MNEHNVCEVLSLYTGRTLLLDTGNDVKIDSYAIETHRKKVEAALAQMALGEVPGKSLDQDAQILKLPLSS